MTATPVADLLYWRSVNTMRELEDIANRVSLFSNGLQGSLTVGIAPAFTRRIVAPTLLRFTEAHPNVKVRIVESAGTQLPQMIAAGEIDFAIGRPPANAPALRVTELIEVIECIIGRAVGNEDSALAGTLPQAPIKIAWPTPLGRRPSVANCLEAMGISIDAELEVDSALTALDLVGRSDWKTAAPSIVMEPEADAGRYALFPLLNPTVYSTFVLMEPVASPMSPAGEVFVETLMQFAREASDVCVANFREAGLL